MLRVRPTSNNPGRPSVAFRTVAHGANFGLCHRLSVGRYFEINVFIHVKLNLLIKLTKVYCSMDHIYSYAP